MNGFVADDLEDVLPFGGAAALLAAGDARLDDVAMIVIIGLCAETKRWLPKPMSLPAP